MILLIGVCAAVFVAFTLIIWALRPAPRKPALRYRTRVVYLHFMEDGGPAWYWDVVDMTSGRIVSCGRERTQPQALDEGLAARAKAEGGWLPGLTEGAER